MLLRNEKQATDWEKIVTKHISDKELDLEYVENSSVDNTILVTGR